VKCGYCDFNAYAGLDGLKDGYQWAMLDEIAGWSDLLGQRPISSISFGGGTPGEFPAADIATLIAAIRARGELADGAEVSLEANPGTTNLDYLRHLRAAGLTRISFGAQSFDSDELRFLDRIHSPEAIDGSVSAARAAGFTSIGLDLIYGLPGQSMASWGRSIGRALALDVDHLSCYALTVEEGTPLARDVARGVVTPLDPDAVADMYELAERRLEAAGYEHYELSNWARAGHQSRHNVSYWSDCDYLGIGAGAHGYVDGQRYENVAHPRAYIEAQGATAVAAAPRPKVLDVYTPPPPTAMFDWLETALRLVAGFEVVAFERRFGVALDQVAGTSLARCIEGGLLEREGPRLRLTPRGRLLHSEVMATVLPELESCAALPG
jgi:oxygen-independent coproporphyrinogen-3 oxidase